LARLGLAGPLPAGLTLHSTVVLALKPLLAHRPSTLEVCDVDEFKGVRLAVRVKIDADADPILAHRLRALLRRHALLAVGGVPLGSLLTVRLRGALRTLRAVLGVLRTLRCALVAPGAL